MLQVTDEKLKEIKEETEKDKTMISLQNTLSCKVGAMKDPIVLTNFMLIGT